MSDAILAPYDPAWADAFAAMQAVYTSALAGAILGIEHVGSTAIPGLWAKPILDIDIVMPDYAAFPQVVEALGLLGYTHHGDQGIVHREVFKTHDSAAPYTEPRHNWMRHHLYVCPAQSEELQRHVRFRDVLRTREDLRREYEQIKHDIARRSHGDRKIYAQIKETECRAFVERVLG